MFDLENRIPTFNIFQFSMALHLLDFVFRSAPLWNPKILHHTIFLSSHNVNTGISTPMTIGFLFILTWLELLFGIAWTISTSPFCGLGFWSFWISLCLCSIVVVHKECPFGKFMDLHISVLHKSKLQQYGKTSPSPTRWRCFFILFT